MKGVSVPLFGLHADGRHGAVIACTIVDEADADFVMSVRWGLQKTHLSDLQYAVARNNDSGVPFRRQLHRVLLTPDQGFYVDHINHDGLDNRRHNLRIVTQSGNQANRRMRSDNKSGYKGVVNSRTPGRFVAQIKVLNRQKYIGTFQNIEAAARAYDQAALDAFGALAFLNFPDQGSA